MSLPGLALPGLDFSGVNSEQQATEYAPSVKTHSIAPETEYRFEASFTRAITIKVLTGNAECFGTELAPNAPYTFRGAKGAIYTWQGATLEVTGEPEGEYIAEETPMTQYINSHFGLENLRKPGGMGPRMLVVGPEDAGKTSLVKILTSYAIKSGRQPCVVNLDPEQGQLAPPGSLTATTFGSILDVEEGWGSSPISGPSTSPVKMPLVYHFGCRRPTDQEKLFKALVTRMAVAVTSRLEDDIEVKEVGCLIDTPGTLATGKGAGYELISHIVSEFSVNVVFVMGSEKVFSEMKRRFANVSHEDPILVLKLDKSGGCVDRDEVYMKQLRQSQIREYFFGRGNINLSPYSQLVDFNQLTIYKINDPTQVDTSFAGGDEDDSDDYDPSTAASFGNTQKSIFTKIQPSMGLQNSLLAITHANPGDSIETIRDSSVMGYIYVADVDDVKKKVKVLGPVGGRIPSRAMVWGAWPEDVGDLIG